MNYYDWEKKLEVLLERIILGEKKVIYMILLLEK